MRDDMQLRMSNFFQTNPLLIRVETKACHGGCKPTTKVIEEVTDGYCFLVRTLGYEFK